MRRKLIKLSLHLNHTRLETEPTLLLYHSLQSFLPSIPIAATGNSLLQKPCCQPSFSSLIYWFLAIFYKYINQH